MKPSAVAVDIGSSEPDLPPEYHDHLPSSYTTTNRWAEPSHQLPLHYMAEDTARRRVRAPMSAGMSYEPDTPKEHYGDMYNDEGKDVYNKVRTPVARIGSGRMPQVHQPPPTSIVRP